MTTFLDIDDLLSRIETTFAFWIIAGRHWNRDSLILYPRNRGYDTKSYFFLTIYYLFIISSTNSFYDYTMFAFISRWIFHDGFTLAFFFLIIRGKVQSEVTRVKVFFFLKAKRREILIQPPVNLSHRPSFPASQVAKRQTKNISAIIEKLRGFRDIVISFFSASRRFFENSFRFNSQQCFSTLFLPFLFSLR